METNAFHFVKKYHRTHLARFRCSSSNTSIPNNTVPPQPGLLDRRGTLLHHACNTAAARRRYHIITAVTKKRGRLMKNIRPPLTWGCSSPPGPRAFPSACMRKTLGGCEPIHHEGICRITYKSQSVDQANGCVCGRKQTKREANRMD